MRYKLRRAVTREIIQLLLEMGADVTAWGGYYHSVLQPHRQKATKGLFGCCWIMELMLTRAKSAMGLRWRRRRQMVTMGLFGYC